MEFRLYGKHNCSLFDLIGNKEPDQTKGLGILLSESKEGMKLFLNLLASGHSSISVNDLLKLDWVVDCEEPIESGSEQNDKNKYRLDIVIRFYKENQLEHIILVEAKSIKAQTAPEVAEQQLNKYIASLDLNTTLFTRVILTAGVKEIKHDLNNTIVLTWTDIITAFEGAKKDETKIIKKYVDYLLKINGIMKHYDVEVATMPTGKSLDIVEDTMIYACPPNYPIVERHPLYFAFRKGGGNNGEITKLYKLKEIIVIDLARLEQIEKENFEKDCEQKEIKNIIERMGKHPSGEQAYFIFDETETIQLPHPVRFTKPLQKLKYVKLSEIFAQPKKDGFVWVD